MDILDIDLDSVPMSESLECLQFEFQSMEMIGEGGFGKVRKAIRRSDKLKVAIKYIANSKITSWHFYSKINKSIPMEIALMCRCREIDGVIKIIKYFQIKEHKGWYIVMERFENYIDLFDHITNVGQISEKDASNYMKQLINILTKCHNLGVCHRDIKDENIIMDLSTKKIYLIDFGAGGILHDGLYSEFDGTRVYSPPEWIQFKKYHAISLEIWSLGILLYDMVCGNLPYDNDESIINSFLVFRKPISRGCQDLIVRCLEKNPEKRFRLADILNHRWITYNSKLNHSELPKSSSQYEYFQHSKTNSNQPKISLPNCPFGIELNSRRISGEISPFVTPQSSGFEEFSDENIPNKNTIDNSKDSDSCHNNTTSNYLIQTKENIKNNFHKFTDFNFNISL